ncbi:hypothetical protein B1813_22380 [Saccharomonospora piscinae]|uniref:Uncharacterized protein n=1 Tax=Saccharomonospora piscinae TaxID=687388 RepID=A0A1V8ZY98_SACPI|nr:hypothetical protein [Saccharomonospora piscinae]OQO89654.1 hypothetical protein B1813_22380 [Saccharomonospora piscinae]
MPTKNADSSFARPSATRTQHAIRLLALLDRCGEAVTDLDPPDTIKVVRSELRLQAMDFWMRNPDYLAGELITQVDGGLDPSYLKRARELVDDSEPDLRWYPMPRWLFGAYEPLDDAFSLLEAYGLATVRRAGEPGQKRHRSQFYLAPPGVDAVAEITTDPVLSWYTEQAVLVHLVAGDDRGGELKKRQYEQATYAETELGSRIGPITDHV